MKNLFYFFYDKLKQEAQRSVCVCVRPSFGLPAPGDIETLKGKCLNNLLHVSCLHSEP